MNQVLFYLGLAIGLFLVLVALYSVVSRIQMSKRKFSEKYHVLQVRVPRENESGPIVAESIFATFHGIQTGFTMWDKLRGYSSDSISFEIASIGRSIKFYVAFPPKLRNLVEGQIYAQYPDVEIEDCDDYSFAPTYAANAMGVELELTNSDVYPIKRYAQFEDKLSRLAVDPIAGITSSMVKFEDVEDQAWVQMVVTPLPDKWRIVFTRCVKILKKGIFANIEVFETRYARAFITRKLWPKVVFFPVYIIFWLQGLIVNAGLQMGSSSMSQGATFDDMDEMTSKSHERETDIDAAMDKVVRQHICE